MMLDIYKQWAIDKRHKYMRESNEARLAKCLSLKKRSFFQWVKGLRK